jgi:hypothetical protein
MHTLAVGTISPVAFLAVTIGYFIGGVLCIILAATGFGGTTGRSRVVSAVIGAACLIYAIYLLAGDAETVFISYYIMALPLILLIRAIVVFVQRRKGTGPQQNTTGTSWPPAHLPQQPQQPNGWAAPGQQGFQPGYGQQPQDARPAQPWPAQPTDPTAPAPANAAFPGQRFPPSQPAPGAQPPYPPQTGYGTPPRGR